MKLLIAFLLCTLMAVQTYCVSVLDESPDDKRFNDLLRDAINECKREMNRDPSFITDEGTPTHPSKTKIRTCVFKKLGSMNEDRNDNLESRLPFSSIAERIVEGVVENSNGKMKECAPMCNAIKNVD